MKQLINNITEDYCSFEVSKLLKEKGCKLKGRCWVERTDFGMELAGKNANRIFQDLNFREDTEALIFYPRPTHALAIEWIRVNFGYMICYSVPEYHNGKVKFSYYIVHDDGFGVAFKKQGDLFNSPQEATETALAHTLKNLI